MGDTVSSVYRTTGCIEPAPYGLFDDEFRFTTRSGAQFHLWSEETHHLFSAIHAFQWDRQLIPLPELPIVTQWNTLIGVFGVEGTPTEIAELAALVAALRVLRSHYADYETAGKQHGYAALAVDDLDALIVFLSNADNGGHPVTISEH